MRTPYIKQSIIDLFTLNIPNAGPHPNITGLRLHRYGRTAYLCKQGAYVYNLTGYPEIIAYLENNGISFH